MTIEKYLMAWSCLIFIEFFTFYEFISLVGVVILPYNVKWGRRDSKSCSRASSFLWWQLSHSLSQTNMIFYVIYINNISIFTCSTHKFVVMIWFFRFWKRKEKIELVFCLSGEKFNILPPPPPLSPRHLFSSDKYNNGQIKYYL